MNCCAAIRRKLETVRGLSPADRRLLLKAWLLLPAVDIGLRLLPFQRLVEILGTKPVSALKTSVPSAPSASLRCQTHSPAPIHRAYWALHTASRNYFRPVTCLRRSLVLQALLNDGGIATDLHLGVRKEGTTLEAHAWLEYQGCPLAEPEAVRDRFKPLAPVN